MFNALFIAIIIVPVLMAVLITANRRERPAVVLLIAFVVTYSFSYMLLLYLLRRRWVG